MIIISIPIGNWIVESGAGINDPASIIARRAETSQRKWKYSNGKKRK